MSAFDRLYLRNQCLFLFLQVLRCFSSLRSLLTPYVFRCRYLITMLGNPSRPYSQFGFSKHLRWVAPFGDPWIKAHSQLPTAFRSVSRPSSPVHAKASTNCPYLTLENPHHQRQDWNSRRFRCRVPAARSCGPCTSPVAP